MTNKTVLLIYGEGGHRAEMDKLFENVSARLVNEVTFIGFFENGDCSRLIKNNIELPVIRDKHFYFKTLINALYAPIIILLKLIKVEKNHNISAVLSVGPGISILPSLYFKLVRKDIKIIYIENSCRFKKSYTGLFMSYLSDYFYVQNKILLSSYPKAIYAGQLL